MRVVGLIVTQGIHGFQAGKTACSERADGGRDAHVRLVRSGFRCPGCGREGVAVYGGREREIAGLPVGRTRLVLHVTALRIYCPGCGATHYERIPFTPSPTARMTRQLERTILELRREMSVSAVAGHSGLSWRTVKTVEKRAPVRKYAKVRLRDVRRRGSRDMDAATREAVKGNRRLFLRNAEKLDPDETAALDRARGLCRPLSDTYMLKERLRSIYASAEGELDAAVLLEEWCALADGTGLPEMAGMAKTVRRHSSGILAFWRHGGATNASQEGFNNKIRWLIGQAYGFRDYEYFRLKIFDLPATDIRKTLWFFRVSPKSHFIYQKDTRMRLFDQLSPTDFLEVPHKTRSRNSIRCSCVKATGQPLREDWPAALPDFVLDVHLLGGRNGSRS